MITTVDFLRHGEAAGGSHYRGITDDPLTKLGWQQMSSVVTDRSWDQIISSPLQRCLGFSQHLSSKTNTSCIANALWQEINFGDWEGKTANQINPEILTRFYDDPVKNPPHNSESFPAFQCRIDQAWDELIQIYCGKHILVITHAGVIRCLFTLLLNLPIVNIFNLQIDHASITRFQCFHDKSTNFTSLIFHNFTSSNLYSSIKSENNE